MSGARWSGCSQTRGSGERFCCRSCCKGAVVYVPFLQQAFSTVSLTATDWIRCAAVGSSVLWLRELSKVVTRTTVSWSGPSEPNSQQNGD
jgi:Cation transporting ATPase, C-terminus